MNYADRARFKATLQRNGAPAMIEEHARTAERLTALEERLAAIEARLAAIEARLSKVQLAAMRLPAPVPPAADEESPN